jgi:hypothetical protein
MLDPLLTLSLASNVLQIVQFTSQLGKQIHEVRNQGTPASISQLRLVTQSAISQAEGIRVQLVSAVPSAADLAALPIYDQVGSERFVLYQEDMDKRLILTRVETSWSCC